LWGRSPVAGERRADWARKTRSDRRLSGILYHDRCPLLTAMVNARADRSTRAMAADAVGTSGTTSRRMECGHGVMSAR
jgi:hypothetical protein